MSLTFLIILSIASPLFALDKTDQKAINQIIDNFATAWNYHGGQGFADYYAEDADFVNIFGMTFVGKQEIEKRHIKILETIFKGSTFEATDVKLREVKPDVVIAHLHWKVTNIQKPVKDTLNETMKGIFTFVFLKNQGKWEIAASQNTTISN